jgi:hypothetical protein
MSDQAFFAVILAGAAGLLLANRNAAAAGAALPSGVYEAIPEGPRIMNAALAAADVFASAWAADEVTTSGIERPSVNDFPAAIFASLGGSFTSLFSGAVPGVPQAARPVLDLIGHAEAPQGYAQIYSGIPASLYPPRSITRMTVDEVLAWQSSIRASVASTAAGRYQFIYATLLEISASTGLRGAMFNGATQDRLAFALMERRGWRAFAAGQTSWEGFANSLAKEWAGLPVVGGMKDGRSYYAGDGLNAAQVSVAAIAAALASARRNTA